MKTKVPGGFVPGTSALAAASHGGQRDHVSDVSPYKSTNIIMPLLPPKGPTPYTVAQGIRASTYEF